jgi:hypothetical protein
MNSANHQRNTSGNQTIFDDCGGGFIPDERFNECKLIKH